MIPGLGGSDTPPRFILVEGWRGVQILLLGLAAALSLFWCCGERPSVCFDWGLGGGGGLRFVFLVLRAESVWFLLVGKWSLPCVFKRTPALKYETELISINSPNAMREKHERAALRRSQGVREEEDPRFTQLKKERKDKKDEEEKKNKKVRNEKKAKKSAQVVYNPPDTEIEFTSWTHVSCFTRVGQQNYEIWAYENFTNWSMWYNNTIYEYALRQSALGFCCRYIGWLIFLCERVIMKWFAAPNTQLSYEIFQFVCSCLLKQMFVKLQVGKSILCKYHQWKQASYKF